MTVPGLDRRVKSYLDRHLKAPVYRFENVPDPRDARGTRWPLRELVVAALLGMVAGCRTLREVEDLTVSVSPYRI